MSAAESLAAWCVRAHERCHERPAGTYGPDDLGCHAGCTRSCTEWLPVTPESLAEARDYARVIHRTAEHPGTPDACQSPHDVLCKAVWP